MQQHVEDLSALAERVSTAPPWTNIAAAALTLLSLLAFAYSKRTRGAILDVAVGTSVGVQVAAQHAAVQGAASRIRMAAIAGGLCWVAWLLAAFSARTLFLLACAMGLTMYAAGTAVRQWRRRGLWHKLSPKAKHMLSQMTFLDFLRSDTITRAIDPYKPLVLGLNEEEMALYLARAPPALRAKLLRPGLLHLLPGGLQGLLLGQDNAVAMQQQREVDDLVREVEELELGQRVEMAGPDAEAVAAAAAIASEQPLHVTIADAQQEWTSAAVPNAAGMPQLRVQAGGAAAGTALPGSSPPPPGLWGATMMRALLTRRLYSRIDARLGAIGLSSSVLRRASITATGVTAMLQLLSIARSRGAGRGGGGALLALRKVALLVTVLLWVAYVLKKKAGMKLQEVRQVTGERSAPLDSAAASPRAPSAAAALASQQSAGDGLAAVDVALLLARAQRLPIATSAAAAAMRTPMRIAATLATPVAAAAVAAAVAATASPGPRHALGRSAMLTPARSPGVLSPVPQAHTAQRLLRTPASGGAALSAVSAVSSTAPASARRWQQLPTAAEGAEEEGNNGEEQLLGEQVAVDEEEAAATGAAVAVSARRSPLPALPAPTVETAQAEEEEEEEEGDAEGVTTSSTPLRPEEGSDGELLAAADAAAAQRSGLRRRMQAP